MTKRESLIWAAGLLEGEGCFRVKPGSIAGYRPSLVVNVSSTDCDVIERCCAVFPGHGKVHERQPANPTHKRQYAVEWYGANAEKLMRAVLPFMGQRRTASIQRALSTSDLSHTHA